MTIPYRGGTQTPGPLGVSLGRTGGRIPGPLRFGSIILAGAPGATNSIKRMKMPAPAGGGTVDSVHEVTSPLFKGEPKPDQIRQGALATCPIASILAALAHTESGRKRIQKLVAERASVVETDIKDVAGKLDEPPANNKVTSKRYFIVTIGGTAYEVSDVFYTSSGDRDTYSLIYAGKLEGGPPPALWPSVIEKAFAVKIGDYENLDDDQKHTANEFWEAIVGSKPNGFAIDDKTDLEKIRAAAKAAGKVPTMAASRDGTRKVVMDHHGYAVLGIDGSTIELYDPWGKTRKISLQDFRSDFQAIFYGNP